jgi:glycosyltransferase involved in cell wall biosynthesis
MHKKLCTLYLSHSSQLYGAEQSLLELLKGLDRNRFSAVVVLPHDGPLRERVENLSIPVEIVPSLTAWLTWRNGIQRFFHNVAVIPFILRSIWELQHLVKQYKIDLIHTNSLVMIDGALTARFLRLPHVWHARELLLPASSFNFFLGPYAVLSIAQHLADRIIATSKAVQNCFPRNKKLSQIVVVYNPVANCVFQYPATKGRIRQEFGVPYNTFLIGEIGKLNPNKGYEDLVQAAAIVKQTIPNIIFAAVGGTSKSDAAFERRFKESTKILGLQDCFKLVGFRNDILEIIFALDLLVLPSHSESFGRVLIEAMAAGKPVIGTSVGGIPEIIEDGVTGLLVPPHSPEELAQAIIKILQNPEMARQMGEAGRRRAEERFSAKQYVTKIQAIYEELLN